MLEYQCALIALWINQTLVCRPALRFAEFLKPKPNNMTKQTKEFEVSLPKAVCFGEYLIEKGKLYISDVHTFDDDEQRVEIDSINDAELFNRIHRLLSEEKVDEIEAEIEDDKASNKSFLINKY